MDHYTQTEEEYAHSEMEFDHEYPASRSHVDPDSFLRVWNEGTAEFDQVKDILEQIPFLTLLEDHILAPGVKKDPLRANLQVGWGYAGGAAYQKNNDASALKYFGASVPSLKTGTNDMLWLMSLMDKLGRRLNLDCFNSQYLSENPIAREVVDFNLNTIGVTRNCLTLAVLPLQASEGEGNTVEKHKDTKNPLKTLADVLVASKVCKSLSNGR